MTNKNETMKVGIEMTETIGDMFREHGPQITLSAIMTAIMVAEGEGTEMTPELQLVHAILTTRAMLGVWIF